MAIRARFKPTPEGEFHQGIPARDLDDDDYAALDNEQRALVRNSPLYRYTAPTPRAARVRARADQDAAALERDEQEIEPDDPEPIPPFDPAADEPAVTAEEGEST